MAINGNDLIEIGFHPGKELGKVLKDLLQLVIDGMDNKRETWLTLAKGMYIANYVLPTSNVASW